jgi:hypothetical protein
MQMVCHLDFYNIITVTCGKCGFVLPVIIRNPVYHFPFPEAIKAWNERADDRVPHLECVEQCDKFKVDCYRCGEKDARPDTDAIREAVDLMDDHTMVVITNKAEFAYIQEHCSRYKLPPYLGERTEFPIAVSLNDGGGWTDRMDRALCYVTFTDAIAILTKEAK